MTLKSKLMLYFSGIAILMVIVGFSFYIQLKNLIEPLTPRSIPRSVELLADVIDRNDLISRLMYQQLLVQANLENYVFTDNNYSLQLYYMNSSTIFQLLAKAKPLNPGLYPALKKVLDSLSKKQSEIIRKMPAVSHAGAAHLINDRNYLALTREFKTELTRYFQRKDVPSNEDAVVTVRLAAQNSYKILQDSLNLTLTILFDAIIASLALVFFSTRAIAQPINQLRNNLEKMDVNRIAVEINPKLLQLKGEVGDLARSFSEIFQKLRIATVVRDELRAEIHRHTATEKQLKKTATELLESNLELDQFAYAASHDLRAPLRAIQSLTQWIQEDCYHLLPQDSRENFDLIIKRVHRLDALIAGMLEYSRAGRMSGEGEPIDLNILIAEITDNLAPPTHVNIIIDTPLPIIRTDRAKITQVFLNLIGNAIKYNDKSAGYIHIGCESFIDYHQFYISDNGCGIDPAFHEKIFEIFQTLQSRDSVESSGIGLSIVRKIIEKIEGKIWLDSELSKGTTFYFQWPVEPITQTPPELPG